ncbi:YfiR family protein [Erwinia persicina]|uniref:YfiR family protein n=1 Tax=Erwinia persicina TaxID=55211 RepID=UPI00210E0920|nr:YfiR family protein [Erwinia persicina]MCQ4095412.1 YfiR family protein [Erwinia persicina]MCQ4099832.1 YfiR family protein [Erwinia persicina]
MAKRYVLLLSILLGVISLPLRSEMSSVKPEGASASDVRQTVAGMISYTRWPHLNGLPRLCVFRSAHYASVLISASVQHPPAVWNAVQVDDVQQALTSQCDVLYFGHESSHQQVELINSYQPRPLLTIAEQTPDCAVGSAFCLKFINHRVSFSVNLDSLGRSGVRVHPDVLMLASSGSERHG